MKLDIGKEVLHIVELGADGKIAFRRKFRRLASKEACEKLTLHVAGMEECVSAHFVSRMSRSLGHEPRIIPTIYVKPFLTGPKSDYNDEVMPGIASLIVRLCEDWRLPDTRIETVTSEIKRTPKLAPRSNRTRVGGPCGIC